MKACQKLLYLVGAGSLLSAHVGCTDATNDGGVDADQSGASAPATVSFQDGVSPSAAYAGAAETMLLSSAPSAAQGDAASIHADGDYPDGTGNVADALLRFDLGSIPKGSTVSAVTLTLNITNSTSGAGYTLYPLSRAWNATQATWNAPQTGGSWSGAGARGTGDRGAAVGTLAPTTTGKATVTLNAAGVAAVQSWVNSPSGNFGYVLDTTNDADGVVFDSSTAATAANRPALAVTYTAPGGGLTGQYFSDQSLTTLALTRVDSTVDFNWGTGAPASSLPADHFSVRWTGTVTPLYSETYTFTTTSDDGVRLWVNGSEIVNNWTDHSSTANAGTVALTAGKAVSIKMEYYENGGDAVAELAWSSAHQAAQVVPASALSPTSGGGGAGGSGGAAGAGGTAGAGGSTGGSAGAGGGGLAGLDPSGATIPDTNYAIPGGAIFLAANGSDSNAGTQSAPVATLNKAISLVPAGGTVVVRGGVYRDWYHNSTNTAYTIVTKGFTLQAYPHEQVWFDGTDVQAANSWTSDGQGHWYKSWSTPQFCDGHYYDRPYAQQDTSSANSGPCTHRDNYGASEAHYPAAGDPQLLFVDGNRAPEVDQLSLATGGAFFYDWSAKRIYVSTDPNGHTLELATRPNALVLGNAANGYTVRGVGFRKYATNEYSNLTDAAVYVGGNNPVFFEHDVFTENAAGGLSVNAAGSTVSLCVFASNGFNGAGYYGHDHTSKVADNFVFENNLLNDNNLEHYGLDCNISCAAAGIKMAAVIGYTLKGNVFENTHDKATGAWCDTDCSGGKFVNNYVYNNGTGYHYEQDTDGIVASNVFVDNGDSINIGSSNTKIWNNTVIASSGNIAIRVYDDNRPLITSGIEVVNNLVEGTYVNVDWFAGGTVANESDPNTWFTRLDYNAYDRPSQNVLYRMIGAQDQHWNTSASYHTAFGSWAAHDIDDVAVAEPFFTNAAGGDYTVRSNSAAYHSGTALPSDIAAALGVPAGTVVSRGALSWAQR